MLFTTVRESDTSVLWQSNDSTISVTAVSARQFLISIILGSHVSSALYETKQENSYEEFETFLKNNLSDGISKLSPNPLELEPQSSDQTPGEPDKNMSRKENRRSTENVSQSGNLSQSDDKLLVELKKNAGKSDSTHTENPETKPSINWQSREQRVSRPSDMPDFDDEYELKARNHFTAALPFTIGEGDMNPAGTGPNPHLQPYIDPLVAPGSGMIPDANHQIFGQTRGNTSRLGAPPGARFDDPYGDDNLDDMGMGLPGNLRQPPFGGPFGGNTSGSSPFGGFGPHFG